MIFLPKNLAQLAALTGAEGHPRYQLQALHVLEYDGFYRVEATDGTRVGIVRGADERPTAIPSGLSDAPNGCFDYLVPLTAWRSAFRTFAKDDGAIGFVGSAEEITMGVSDCTARSRPGEGRFPGVDAALPTTPPLVRLKVDPRDLAELLRVASAFADAPTVELVYWPKRDLLGVMAGNGRQTFDGLLSCLSAPTVK